MKKKSIALGVVVTLGVIWAGSTWYIGKQIETRKDETITQINALLAERFPAQKLSVSAVDYHRGFFSSTAQIVFQSAQTGEDAVFSPDDKLVFNTNIEHGPFPVSALKQFNLVPSLAQVHSELVNNKLTQAMFVATSGHTPLVTDSVIGLSGGSDSTIRLAALNIPKQEDGSTIKSEEFKIQLNTDKSGDNIQSSGSLPLLTFNVKDENGAFNNMQLNDLTFKGNRVLSASGLPIGDSSLAVKKFTLTIGNEGSTAVSDLTLNSNAQESQGKYAGTVKYHASSIQYNNAELGSSDLQLSLKNLDAKVLKAAADEYRTIFQGLMSGEQSGDSAENIAENAADAAIERLGKHVQSLLQGGPVFSIDTLKLKNNSGESDFNFAITLKNGGLTPDSINNIQQALTKSIQQLSAHLSINQPMAEELVQQFYLANGVAIEDAKSMAKQNIAGVAALGEMTQLVAHKDNNVVSDLAYSDDKVTLNGETQPVQDFIDKYLPDTSAQDESVVPDEQDESAVPDEQEAEPDAAPAESAATPDDVPADSQ